MSVNLVLDQFLEQLWVQYKKRVNYAARYQTMVEEQGGQLRNDHIAFRSFMTKTGAQPPGVEGIARIFECLGYQRKDQYLFPDKKLTAWHWEHSRNSSYPKIFISQLEVDQLTPPTAFAIREAVADCPNLLSTDTFDRLLALGDVKTKNPEEAAKLADHLVRFCSRPWSPPLRSTVERVNNESQYAAWTLLHGNAVNHFTAYINEQQVASWPDLETTVNALRQAGLPMKDEFEGEKGSKLRQSSTKAVMVDCDVKESDDRIGKISWSYAYYELAERNNIPGPDGRPVRFQGFLGAQATNLFEMTKRA